METDYINIIAKANQNGLGVIDIANKIKDRIDVYYNVTYTVLLLNNEINKIKYYAILKDNIILAYGYYETENQIYGIILIDNINKINKININNLLESNSIYKNYLKIVDNYTNAKSSISRILTHSFKNSISKLHSGLFI